MSFLFGGKKKTPQGISRPHFRFRLPKQPAERTDLVRMLKRFSSRDLCSDYLGWSWRPLTDLEWPFQS
jgi:hypothetical protein